MANLILSISPPFPKPPTWSFLKQNQNTITFLGILDMEALLSSTGRDCKPVVAGNRCHHVETSSDFLSEAENLHYNDLPSPT